MNHPQTDSTKQYQISIPATLRARITLPASKSISNRALILNALASRSQGDGAMASPLVNLSDCDDTRVMVEALNGLPSHIDIGAAGTAMRFLTALLATTPGERLITGSERMRQRPIRLLVDALRQLGASIRYRGEEGFPPLSVQGRQLEGGELEMAGHVSSQYISALLMIAPTLNRGLRLRLTGEMISRPYIEMTLGMMRDFGASVSWEGPVIDVAPTGYQRRPYRVESDWSAASYWFEMMALTDDAEARLVLPGLDEQSRQGDAVVREIFRPLGVHADFRDGDLVLTKGSAPVSRLEYDFVNCPDLAQTVVVCCAVMGTHFRFTGLQSLKIKETDRIVALQTELRKLGYVVGSRNDNELYWEGERCEPQAHPAIDTYADHRMAMAFAPAAHRFPQLVIRNPQVVTKSYPHFWSEVFQVSQ